MQQLLPFVGIEFLIIPFRFRSKTCFEKSLTMVLEKDKPTMQKNVRSHSIQTHQLLPSSADFYSELLAGSSSSSSSTRYSSFGGYSSTTIKPTPTAILHDGRGSSADDIMCTILSPGKTTTSSKKSSSSSVSTSRRSSLETMLINSYRHGKLRLSTDCTTENYKKETYKVQLVF